MTTRDAFRELALAPAAELERRPVDGVEAQRIDGTGPVDRTAEHIDHPAKQTWTDRDLEHGAATGYGRAPAQATGGAERDAAHGPVVQVRLHLEHARLQAACIQSLQAIGQGQIEAHVDDVATHRDHTTIDRARRAALSIHLQIVRQVMMPLSAQGELQFPLITLGA